MPIQNEKESLQKLFTCIGFDIESPALDLALDLIAIQMHSSNVETESLIHGHATVVLEKAAKIQRLEASIENLQSTLDDTGEEFLIAQQQIKSQIKELLKKDLRCDQYEVELRRLKEKNAQAYKLLGQIHHEITTRKKKMRIAEYDTMLDDIVKCINGIMPKQSKKEKFHGIPYRKRKL